MNQIKKEKQTYTCLHCEKVYKNKRCFDKHFEKCEEREMELFNYQGLIEELTDYDPDFAKQFQYEMDLILEKRG